MGGAGCAEVLLEAVPRVRALRFEALQVWERTSCLIFAYTCSPNAEYPVLLTQFALRWRTEEEVISGAGETTCGNTRCSRHFPRNIDPDDPRSSLTTLELPFSYMEDGEGKFALVKVVLCAKCCKKLMWKRNKEKEKEKGQGQAKEGELQVKQESEAGDDDIILGRLGAEEPGGGRAGGETRTAEISGSADARSSRQREKTKTRSTDQPDVADPIRIPSSRSTKHTTGVDSRERHHRERHRRSSRSRSPRRRDAEPRKRPRSPS